MNKRSKNSLFYWLDVIRNYANTCSLDDGYDDILDFLINEAEISELQFVRVEPYIDKIMLSVIRKRVYEKENAYADYCS